MSVKGRAVIRTIFSFHGSGALIHNGDDPIAVDGLCGGGGATEAGSSWFRWRDQRPCRRIWSPANSGVFSPEGEVREFLLSTEKVLVDLEPRFVVERSSDV